MSEVLKASDFSKLEKIIKIVEDKGQIACYETMDDSNKEIHMRYQIETERSDLFDVNIVITMKVCLDKDVPIDELKSAFDKACKVHEVLQSRVVIESTGEAYYVDNDRMANSFSRTDQSLTDLIYSNERCRFRIEEGEFIRAYLSPDGLVFMMHHLGGDGKSLLYFIESFMRCLAGMECEKVPFKSLGPKDLPEKGKMPFFYRQLVRSWNHKWLRQKQVFDFTDMDTAYSKFWGEHRTKVWLKTYERNELESLIKNAKNAGTSLTAYLIADMIKDSKKKMDVGLAVDGRLDKNRSMGNQATGISVQYRYDKNKSLDENARKIHKRMQKKLSNDRYRYFVLEFMGKLDSTLKDALNLERAGYFSRKFSKRIAGILGYGENVKDLSITNLTRADIPLRYGDYTIEEIAFIPPIVSYAKNVIGIVTVGDVMNISGRVYDE